MAKRGFSEDMISRYLNERSKIVCLVLLLALMAAGLYVRLENLDYVSLSHDEVGMTQYTRGLLQKGFPAKVRGEAARPILTYEIVPYSISVPVLLFGLNDFTARLHSVFWGTLEILLIYLMGKALFNRRTGLIASLIYVFHPWCTIWSQNVFYPQLTQFLSVLTVLFLYKAVKTDVHKKYIYLTAVFFSLMYLSWEGSGFLLPSLFLAVAVYKGSDLSWLKSKHLWISLAIVFLTVFLQQSRRMLYQSAYLSLGSSITDISFPQLFFLDPLYNPFVYLDSFLFLENNYVMTIFLIAGIPLLKKHRPLRFLYAVPLVTLFFMTNFLQVSSTRYVYYLEPYLILSASAVCFLYFEEAKGIIFRKTFMAGLSVNIAAVMTVALLFISSNGLFMKLYLLSSSPSNPPSLVRRNVYWNDYRSTNEYVSRNVRDGDIVFAAMPHTLDYYGGIKADFSLKTIIGKTIFYNLDPDMPGFYDKFMGNPIITSFDEFKRIINSSRRVWFISAPHRALMTNDADSVNYIKLNFKIVYESYNAKVYLYER